jgi:predicted TIM-barrel fold metal-dependent hydrolase
LAEYRPNVYLGLSGFQTEVRRKNFGSILWRHKQRGTTRKLLFGTDWPIHLLFGRQQEWVAEMRKAVDEGILTPEELDQIFFRNAAEVLKLAI